MAKAFEESSPAYSEVEKAVSIVREDLGSSCDNAQSTDSDFQGNALVHNLANGLIVTMETVTAIRDHHFLGSFPASLMLRLPLGTDRPVVNSTLIEPFHPDLADAAVMATDQVSDFEIRIHNGQRFQTFGIIALPEQLTDTRLASLVREAQSKRAVKPFVPSPRARLAALDLLNSEHQDALNDLRIESCAIGLLTEALEALCVGCESSEAASTSRLQLERVRQLLIDYPEQSHKIDELAALAGMSATSLRRKFSDTYGHTLGAFLREVRLLRAYEGLLKEGWSASQTAYRVGYSHPSSFSQAFKRRFGTTPSSLTD
ncbi:MAG: AraC family transcriptional regulator [Pseudomonadota bacterium]